MSTPTLFDLDTVRMDSPRLAAIKAADIQTHHAPHMPDESWIAIPMNAARKQLHGYITNDEPFNTIDQITATFGILLDDWGLLFTGDSEKEVQDAALAYIATLS